MTTLFSRDSDPTSCQTLHLHHHARIVLHATAHTSDATSIRLVAEYLPENIPSAWTISDVGLLPRWEIIAVAAGIRTLERSPISDDSSRAPQNPPAPPSCNT